jgi:hypothetical protein
MNIQLLFDLVGVPQAKLDARHGASAPVACFLTVIHFKTPSPHFFIAWQKK